MKPCRACGWTLQDTDRLCAMCGSAQEGALNVAAAPARPPTVPPPAAPALHKPTPSARVAHSEADASSAVGSDIVVGKSFAFVAATAFKKPAMSWLRSFLSGPPQARIVSLLGPGLVHLPGSVVTPTELPKLELVSITTDKALYRAGQDDVNVLLIDPLRAEGIATLVVKLSGVDLLKQSVELDENGAGMATLRDLPAGAYELSAEGLPSDAPATFNVAEYRLAPLVASLSSRDLHREQLRVVLRVESYGVPYDGRVRVDLMERDRRLQQVSAEARGGVLEAEVKLVGEGPHSLNVQLEEDASRTATVPLVGSRASERSQTLLSRLGNEVTASLIPSDTTDRPVRGLYLQEGATHTSPFALERVDAKTARLVARASIDRATVVVIDPSVPRRRATAVDPALATHPTHHDPRYAHGEKLFNEKKYETATAVLEEALRRLEGPPHPYYAYSLACCYALTGQKARALGALRRALADGWADLDHLAADDDLRSLQGTPGFESILRGGLLEIQREKLAAGDAIEIPITGPFAILAIGAYVNERPWEGWTSVIRPTDEKPTISVGPSPEPGEETEIVITTPSPASLYVVVKDARLQSTDTPESRLAAGIKSFVEGAAKELWIGSPQKTLAEALAERPLASRTGICPRCGAPNAPFERYCSVCASPLDGGFAPGRGYAPPPPPPPPFGPPPFGPPPFAPMGGFGGAPGGAFGPPGMPFPSAPMPMSLGVPMAPGMGGPPGMGPPGMGPPGMGPGMGPPPPGMGMPPPGMGAPSMPGPRALASQPMAAAAAPPRMSSAAAPAPPRAQAATGAPPAVEGSPYRAAPAVEHAPRAITAHEPEVLYAGFVRPRGAGGGGGSLRVRLAGDPADYVVEAFAVRGVDWAHAQHSFRAERDESATLELPAFVHTGDGAIGRLHVVSRSGGSVRLLRDGAEVALRERSDATIAPGHTELSFVALPGAYTLSFQPIGQPEQRSERRVERPGKLRRLTRTVTMLQPGEALDLSVDPSIVALKVLPSLDKPFRSAIDATSDYGHACCEQTAAKMLAACAMYVLADSPMRRSKAEAIIIAGVVRERSMWLRGRGFKMYPESSAVPDSYWGPKAAQYLWNLSLLRDLGGPHTPSASLRAAIEEALTMAADATAGHRLEWPPRPTGSCESIYLSMRFGKPDAGRALDEVRRLIQQLSRARGAVAQRTETAYAAALLFLGAQATDRERALALANLVLQQLEPEGRLYSTVDSVALIALFSELSAARVVGDRGVIEVDGRALSPAQASAATSSIQKLRAIEGVAAVEVARVVEEDWDRFDAQIDLAVSLEDARGKVTRKARPGDALTLVVQNASGYKAGDLCWVCLPDALSRVVGGGQVKRFSVDFEGKDLVRVPLAATQTTVRADGSPGPAHFGVLVRNMFEQERAGNPGVLEVTVA